MLSKTTEEIALDIISIIDYDIYKECEYEIEEKGYCGLVEELKGYINEIYNN